MAFETLPCCCLQWADHRQVLEGKTFILIFFQNQPPYWIPSFLIILLSMGINGLPLQQPLSFYS